MVADSSIYSLIRPVQPGPGPLQNYGQAMQLRALIDDQGLKQLQRQQLERGIQDDDALRQIEQESMGDPTKMRQGMSQRGLYRQRMDFDKNQAAAGKTEAEAMKIDRENFVALADNARKRMAAVRDPQAWQVFRDEQIQMAGMFKTPAIREAALRAAQSMPAEFNPNYIRDSLVKAEELFTPRLVERTDGQRKWMEDTNPFTNPAILSRAPTQMQMTPGEAATDARGRQANAISAGNLGVSRERLAMDRENAAKGKWVNDLERGLQVNQDTGETRPITQGGAPIGPKEKELNEAQSKALLFSNRMEEAEKAISSLAERGVNVSTPGARTGYGVGAAVNVFNPAERQQLDQAKRNFINAVLRRESGAVISDSEFANAEQQYFPQIGDAKDTIEQKARNRRTAIEGIKAEIPKAKRGEAKPAERSPTVFDKLPDPAKYAGKRMEADDGTIYQSDGKRWVRK